MSLTANMASHTFAPFPEDSNLGQACYVSVPRTPATLLVSPEREDHILLQAVFHRQKWRLHSTDSHASAIAELRRSPIPLILSERNFPSGDWIQLFEQTRDLPHRPLTVVASRAADEYLWSEVLNLGAHDVLAKPFLEPEIVRVIGHAWRRWGAHL